MGKAVRGPKYNLCRLRAGGGFKSGRDLTVGLNGNIKHKVHKVLFKDWPLIIHFPANSLAERWSTISWRADGLSNYNEIISLEMKLRHCMFHTSHEGANCTQMGVCQGCNWKLLSEYVCIHLKPPVWLKFIRESENRYRFQKSIHSPHHYYYVLLYIFLVKISCPASVALSLMELLQCKIHTVTCIWTFQMFLLQKFTSVHARLM